MPPNLTQSDDFRDDYRKVIRERIQKLPKKGRGQIEKLAAALSVHQSYVSQVLNGTKGFSDEQILAASRFLKFTDFETKELLLLAQIDRTSNKDLKRLFSGNLTRLRQAATRSSALGENANTLNDFDQSQFYSHWTYVAVWLLTSVPGLHDRQSLAKRLRLPVDRVTEIVNFLIKTGLCVETKDGLSMGIKRTLVTKDSPMVSRHHLNWRLKAIDSLHSSSMSSIFYSQPMVISENDAKKIKEILIRALSEIEPMVEPSPSEKTYCLNLDWFEY